MKFKVVPEPPDSLETVAAIHAAVSLVPDEEVSCCARLMQRTTVDSQDRAKEWLTFLRALGLAEEVDGKYRRVQRDIDPGELREAFRERVYLADEVLSVVDLVDDSLDSRAVFERVQTRVTQWERLRHTDPETVWHERVRRLLDWAVLLELLVLDDDGYRPR